MKSSNLIDTFAIIKNKDTDSFIIKFIPFFLEPFGIYIDVDFPILIVISDESYEIEKFY